MALLVAAGGFLLAFCVSAPLAGRSIAVLENMYDREERATKRAREALAERDELLNILAHDLRNPIQSILLRADLASRAADPYMMHIHVQSIKEATGWISDARLDT